MVDRASVVLVASFAMMVVAGACNCGGTVTEGGACASDSECAGGLLCVEGVCRTDGSPDGSTNGDGGDGNADSGRPCVNLECQQVACSNGATTRITGTVFAPNGTLPLYNALVFVPNGQVSPFTPGVSCDRCGSNITGTPLVQATTRFDGTFVLDNVPAGDNIPLVIQMGRWRRQLVLSKVNACESVQLEAALTRLPRTQAEGDIPQMAIATGDADPFECLLRKVGLDDSEFTLPTGAGRVHYYRVNGINMDPPAPAGSTLWGSLDTLKKYDVVMLPCEGAENPKSLSATQNIIDYTSAGGRLFATHFSYAGSRAPSSRSPPPRTGTLVKPIRPIRST